ncbi:hypothetical protein [Parvimonas micra]
MKIYKVLFPEIKMKHKEEEMEIIKIKESNLEELLKLTDLEPVILTKDTSKNAIDCLVDNLNTACILLLQEEIENEI